jgi:hypothetical protein
MKHLLFAFASTVLFASSLSAQQDTVRTLVHVPKVRQVGLYIAPEFQYGQSNAAFTTFSGGSAMLILNNRFTFGATVQETINETFSPTGVSPLMMKSTFGGAKMEYTLHPSAAVHFTFPLILGMGTARADSLNERSFHTHNEGVHRDSMHGEFLVIQPGVQIEANLLRWVKLFAGVNYRISSAIGTTSILPTDALQGFGINAGLKIGLFDKPLRPLQWRKKKLKS